MPLPFPPFRQFYPYYNNRRFSPYKNHKATSPTLYYPPNTVPNNTESFNNSNKESLTNFDKKESLTKNDERSNEKSIETINSINSINSTKSTNPFSSLFSFLPSSLGPLSFNPDALVDNSIPIFEMFGIHLILDDIIISCILIFLYKEEVKDKMLYIILFLLLLS